MSHKIEKMDQIQRIVRKFHLHQIEMRKLDGDIVIACYTSNKRVDSTRITSVDLKSLSETIQEINKPTKIIACSIISTADRSEKIVCITFDPHWHLNGNVSRLFSNPLYQTSKREITHVKAIEDAITYGFAENGLDIIVDTQEEAFDDEGATCFLDLIFCNDTDRIIFDIDNCITTVSSCLLDLNLGLIHFELHDLQGEWNHMRICLTVEKNISKSCILKRESNVIYTQGAKTSERKHEPRQFFLYVLLCFTVTAIFVWISNASRERILQVFF